MRKSKRIVNIIKLVINIKVVNILLTSFIVLVLLFFGQNTIVATSLSDQDAPGRTSPQEQAEKKRINLIKNVITDLFGMGGEFDAPSPSISPQPNPPLNITPNVPNPYTGTFKSYRQCNYRDIIATTENGVNCSLCKMGCGITSVAMIITSLNKTTVDPVEILNNYKTNGESISCFGTNTSAAKNTLEEYGLKTSGYLFNYDHASAPPIEDVAEDIRPYLESGWVVFALTDFCEGGCGHFIVLTGIDKDNVVTSFDPYYEPPESSSQPINYDSRSPLPYYRAAFAVKKT